MTPDTNPVETRMMTLAERDRLGLPPIEWMQPVKFRRGRQASRAVWIPQDAHHGICCGRGVPGLAVGDRVAVGWDATAQHLVIQKHPDGPYRITRGHSFGSSGLSQWCRDHGMVPGVHYPVHWVEADQILWVRVRDENTTPSRRDRHVD
jgi:transposase InsO family protein